MRAFNVMHHGPWNFQSFPNQERASPREVLDIGRLPATGLYDFCNAFPTMLHEWLFMVLKAIKLPAHLIWIIHWLYFGIEAYSCGAGDGSKLFSVLGG